MDAISLLERGVRTAPRGTTVDLLAQALDLSPAEREAFIAAARRRPVVSAPQAPPDLRMGSSTFVGRERELASARALLQRADIRLLTLTGPPGTGKTRLALEVASAVAGDYDDGVTVASLGPIGDPALVMQAIRGALGLRETPGRPALETVAAHCWSWHRLLVLDNFEHVLAAGPELIELLARCQRLQLLVTSQAALRVRTEHELPVPPLGGGASVALFVERAEAAAPGFRLTAENEGAVAAICRRLDGLPLTLELAAPWLRLLTPEQLLERLDRRLELLVEGPRDMPERQRTLRAALDWTCELLEPEPLALLRRLSVFSGGAPLDALEGVCQAAGPLSGGVMRHLAVLVDHSLVRGQDASGGESRPTMLESVREYGRELLRAAGELEATAQAHLEHYVELAVRSGDQLSAGEQESCLERLRHEHDNVRAALTWAVECGAVEAGLRLGGAIWLFWDYDGHRQEGLDWLECLLAASGSAQPAVRAQALHAAGRLAEEVGSYDSAIARHEESLRIFRELGDLRGVAAAQRGIALALGNQGDHGRAIFLIEEAISVLRELEDPALLASALMNLGVLVSLHADPQRSTALYEEALALRRGVGDSLGTALCLINLAERAGAEGDLDRAQARLDEAVSIARRLQSPYHLGAALVNLGEVARMRADVAGAATRYREGLRLFARIGERSGAGVCVRLLAWVAWTRGRLVSAARLYGAAEALCPAATAPDNTERERAVHERACAALREQLGEDGFATAREAGAFLSMEEAVAEAARDE